MTVSQSSTPRRRGALETAISPHPLADGLPAIFRASLERDEARVLMLRERRLDDAAIAEEIERDSAEVVRLERAAWAKLGLASASPATAAARARQDTFLERLCEGLDKVLAPVAVTLDSLDAYVQPDVAPDDFLAWLGGWMGLGMRVGWPEPAWRSVIAEAATLYRRRGTAWALRRFVELYSEADVEIEDPAESEVVDDALDMPTRVVRAVPLLVVVRIRGGRIEEGDRAKRAGLEAVARAATPAHLALRLELMP